MIELESAIWGVLGLLLFAAALRVNAKEEGGRSRWDSSRR